jgi:hypothetical protein
MADISGSLYTRVEGLERNLWILEKLNLSEKDVQILEALLSTPKFERKTFTIVDQMVETYRIAGVPEKKRKVQSYDLTKCMGLLRAMFVSMPAKAHEDIQHTIVDKILGQRVNKTWSALTIAIECACDQLITACRFMHDKIQRVESSANPIRWQPIAREFDYWFSTLKGSWAGKRMKLHSKRWERYVSPNGDAVVSMNDVSLRAMLCALGLGSTTEKCHNTTLYSCIILDPSPEFDDSVPEKSIEQVDYPEFCSPSDSD